MKNSSRYHVGRPNIGDGHRLQRRFAEILERQWLTNNGPFVQQFEIDFAHRCEVKHCIAVSSGTIALELASRALGLQGEVILPSFTFVATAHALRWHGIHPVFCDIDPETLCIDSARVEPLITNQTKAIMGVHVYGRTCDIEQLQQLATANRLHLMFDAAHAVGCSHDGQHIGGFGVCEIFSFHATKVLNTIEGGAITTNNDQLAAKLRRMRNFGFPGDGRDVTVELGTNGKMNEFCAAMGLTNLEYLDEFITANRVNYHAYQAGLVGVDGFQILEFDENVKQNYQYVIGLVDEDRFGQTRNGLIKALEQEGVLARRYFHPGCHAMEPYATLYPTVAERLPVTERISHQVIALPTGTQLGPSEIGEICEFIRKFHAAS